MPNVSAPCTSPLQPRRESHLFIEPGPLGLRLIESKPAGFVRLQAVNPGSPAVGNVKLRPGEMRLAALREGNGPLVELSGMSYSEVLARLKAAGRPLLVEFEDTPPLEHLASGRPASPPGWPSDPGGRRLSC